MRAMLCNKSMPAVPGKLQSGSASASPCTTRCPSPAASIATDPSVKSIPSRRSSAESLDGIAGVFDARTFVRHHKGSNILKRRYDLDQNALAAGGYGKVYKANDKYCAGRVVAIKKCVCVDEPAVQEVKKEARIMQEMDHPSICKIFEVYQERATLFLVMEYCEGGEVFERIEASESGSLTEQVTADIVAQIAGGLKYAHHHGIAHRDLKPENVCFCTADQASTEVKVIDWGLSSEFLTKKMKSTVGSATYAAPEVIRSNDGRAYTSACDLWSLGVLTYSSLSGKIPFFGRLDQKMRNMLNEVYPMSGPEWYVISCDAKDFIQGLLKANPERRTPIDTVLSHPFLHRNHTPPIARSQVRTVLENMLRAGSASCFFGICMASAARQLDSNRLQGLRKIFLEFDKNGDGVLDLAELQDAFKQSYGSDHDVMARVGHVFSKLDLDGSQSIGYTEFCAAGIGEELIMQEEVLQAAFKAFDVCKDDGIISVGEIQHVLSTGGAHASLPKGLCEKVAREVVGAYDSNKDGGIDFSEFKRMMRSSREAGTGASSSLETPLRFEEHGQEEHVLLKAKDSTDHVGTVREQKKSHSWVQHFLRVATHASRRTRMPL